MATKKKKPPAAPKKEKDERTMAEKIRDHVRKEMGDPTAAETFAGVGLSSVKEVMPTRLGVIDHWVAGIGGLPYGRSVEIAGPEDVGKSSLINHLIWAAQQDGAVASLGDSERKVQPDWVDVFKVDRSQVLLLPARTIEEYLQDLTIIIKKYKRTKMVHFLDSVATTQPQKALDEDLTENEIPGAMAAAWSRGMRALNPVLSESRSILVLVNQLRCVSENEMVITENGICAAGYARSDAKIAGISGSLTRIAASAVSSQIAYRVLLKDGRYLSCGGNHPVLSTKAGRLEWVKARDLRGGNWVAVPRQVELPDVPDAPLPRLPPGHPKEEFWSMPTTASEAFCGFLGMWFSDGALLHGRDRALVFSEKSLERASKLKEVAASLGWAPTRFGPYGYRFGSRIVRLLDSIGCQVGAGNKDIPAVITGKRQWRAFLHCMFDSHPVARGFYLTFENKLAARKVQLALLGFGVYSSSNPSRGGNGTYLYVSGVDAVRYAKEIGFVEAEKGRRVLAAVGVADESARGKADVVPGVSVSKALSAAMKLDGGKAVEPAVRQRLWAVFNADLNVAARDYRVAAPAYGIEDQLTAHRWVQVRQVFKGKIPVQMVDFDVPDGESFVAGGVVTHNSRIGNMYGPTEDTAAGRALKYYLTLRLWMYHGKWLKDGARTVGKWSGVRAVKNHLIGERRSGHILLNYETGWDDDRSTLMAARELKVVDPKCRSVKEARQALNWGYDEAAPDVVVEESEQKSPPG